MDLLFVWWGAAWLGHCLLSASGLSPLLLDAFWAVMWLILLLPLKRRGLSAEYGLCMGGTARLFTEPPALAALLAMPGINLLLILLYGPAYAGADGLPALCFAAAAEELLFRGLLLRLFRRVLNLPAARAVTLSAALFAAAHGLNGLPAGYLACQIGCAFAMGLCFGALYLYSGSLLPPVLIHILTNLTGRWVIEAAGLPCGLLYTAGGTVYLCAGLYYLKRHNTNTLQKGEPHR